MIDLTSSMMYRIGNLDVQNERISYQMSTGKVIDRGSDDSVLYGRYLDVEDNLRTHEGLKVQIEKTTAQNNVADSSVDEIKKTLDSMKVDLLKSLNSGMTRSDRLAVATNMEGMRENLITLSNTTVDGEYLFSGSNTTKQTFIKDNDFEVTGKVDFGGNGHLRNIAVDPGVYRDRGVTAHDVLMYSVDTSSAEDKISFQEVDIVVDENGNTWKLNGSKDQLVKLNEQGVETAEYLKVTNDGGTPKTYTSETLTDANNASRIKDSTASGLLLEAKHSIFEDLNVIINALKGYNTQLTDDANDGKQGTVATDEEVRDTLSNYLGKLSNQYDATNIGHAELGGRNKIFETALESLTAKVTHYNILMQETNGADMAKLAMESKSLEMTYNALYSTVSKMHQLSLVNFIN
ncbi:MAG: flagellin [Arcobacteraceae bacterium]|nr:flagellin [Arcobacteraceae bacterium]